MIDAGTELAYSSEMEVELRAATVITVDSIFEKVQQTRNTVLLASVGDRMLIAMP